MVKVPTEHAIKFALLHRETIYSLQILRFVAAMAVVLKHALDRTLLVYPGFADPSWWDAGSVGVDLFFVISGYLMVVVTIDNPGLTPVQFSAKRLTRIVPLYWICTVTAFLLTTWWPHLFFGSVTIQDLLTSLFFVPDALPGGKVVPVIPAGWTLNLEVPFYLLMAACMLFGRSYLVATIATLSVVYLVSASIPHGTNLYATFYASGGIVLEFAFGAMLALLLRHGHSLRPMAGGLLAVIGIAFLYFLWGAPGTQRVISSGVPALLVVAGSVIAEPLVRRYPPALLVLIGNASYSIYLVHMIWMAPFMRLGVVSPDIPMFAALGPMGFCMLLIVGSLVIGVGVHLWLEMPSIRFLRQRLLDRAKLQAARL